MAKTEIRATQLEAVSLTAEVTGTLPVANGGTGVATLTGIVEGNGTGAFTAATAGTDYLSPGATQTVTATRITKRVNTVNAPGATPTIATDSYDQINFTGINAAITSLSSGLTGTPTDGQKLILRFEDNGTARAITAGASYRAIGVTLSTTTVVNKTLYWGCIRNVTDSIWDVVAIAQEA